MLRTLKPEDINFAVRVAPGAVQRLSPKAIEAALSHARRSGTNKRPTCLLCGKEFDRAAPAQKYCQACRDTADARRKKEYMQSYFQRPEVKAKRRSQAKKRYSTAKEEHKQAIAEAIAPDASTSAHWHFRINENGGPTCYFPSRNAPSAPHVQRPAIAGEKQDEAWDRYCEVNDDGKLRWKVAK